MNHCRNLFAFYKARQYQNQDLIAGISAHHLEPSRDNCTMKARNLSIPINNYFRYLLTNIVKWVNEVSLITSIGNFSLKYKNTKEIKMNKQIKRFCASMIMMLVFYCICNSIGYARLWQNWRECTNEPDCISQFSVPELKSYIIDSSGYFLNSHSDYQAFLSHVELAEINCINYIELKETLYLAIENMEKAITAYTNLKTASEKMPLNQAMIAKLMKFDYNEFQVRYGLLEPVFEKVKSLLGKGNIIDLDMAVLGNMNIILSQLYDMKVSIDKNQLPEISLLWRANQSYAETQLFGQYVSEVFKNILF